MSSMMLARSSTETPEMETVGVDQRSFQTSAGPVSMRITSDPSSIAREWQQIQDDVACTNAQTLDWARAWSAHVLAAKGRRAVIAIGYGPDGGLLFLLPFETEQVFGQTVLRWLGQDHANYLFGLFQPAFAAALSKSDVARLLNETGRWSNASAAVLEAQPYAWGGTGNPVSLLSHQPAPNKGYAVELGDFETLYVGRFSKRARQSLLRKERRLLDSGTLAYGWASSAEEKLKVLNTFFAQKTAQLDAMGVSEVFTPDTCAFFRSLALLPDDNPSRLRLGYVSLNGNILATFSGSVTRGRMNVMLSSMADGPYQRQSPGAQLLRHQIEEACREGLSYFDLGVGAARHKSEWSNIAYDLFDSYIALKPQGLAVTLPLAAKSAAKRTIKTNPRLWTWAQRLRKSLRGGNA